MSEETTESENESSSQQVGSSEIKELNIEVSYIYKMTLKFFIFFINKAY